MQSPAPLMISHLLRTPLANTPDQLIIHGNVLRYSYRQFRSRLGRLANALRKLGVGQGGRGRGAGLGQPPLPRMLLCSAHDGGSTAHCKHSPNT